MATKNYPPGPPSGLLGLHLLSEMRDDYLGFARRLFQEYGDAIHYRIGNLPVFHFTHPDQYHEVLVARHKSFHKTGRFKAIFGRWNGNGLLLNEGSAWARQKRLVQPAFNPQRLQGYAELVVRRTRALFEPCAGQTINVADVLQQLTFETTAEALFGADVSQVVDEFRQAVSVMQESAYDDFFTTWLRPMWWPTPKRRRLRRAVRVLDNVVRGFISRWREHGQDRGDLLSMMLMAVDEEEGTGQMTDRQARDESVGLLLGGNETTATALVWTAYLLATNENVQEELQREVDHVCGGSDPGHQHVPRLALTTACLREAMRLYPPAYTMSRQAIEPVEIGGYNLPRGSQVQLPLFLTHRDIRWFDRPDDYVPHRFLGDGEEHFPRTAYIPFGIGPRACIGRGLALMEGTLVLATLVRRFWLELAADQSDLQLEAQVSLHPKGGIKMNIVPRT